MIQKILRIKNIGVFRNYSWNTAKTSDFSKFNAIYGWNGSGKSTLSRLFACLENGTPGSLELNDDSSCLFDTDRGNQLIAKDNIPEANKNIQVFNEDFVADNLKWEETKAAPILIVGKTKIDQKDKLETIRKRREKKQGELEVIVGRVVLLEKDKDKILDKIRNNVIADLSQLTDITPLSGRAKQYRTYSATDAEKLLTKEGVSFPALSDEEKVEKKNALSENAEKPKLNDYAVDLNWFDDFVKRIQSALSTSLTTAVHNALNEEIGDDDSLREWLREGHALHSKEHRPITCKFCKNEISETRLTELDSYFDEALKQLMFEVFDLLNVLEQKSKLPIPENVERLYKEFESDYSKAKEDFFLEKSNLENRIESAKVALQKKQKRPFEQPHIDTESLISTLKAFVSSVERLNKVIARHNEKTDQFATRRVDVAHTLELFIVGSSKVDFDEKMKNLQEERQKEDNLKKDIQTEKDAEEKLGQELKDHGLGAGEFNKLLQSFLGRSEITFAAVEAGYSITRNKKPAKNLSEGEKNAIALVFFLTKMREEGFDPSRGVIVIDDPVSSFDSQHIYQAYGFIKAKIKEVQPAQFFILTHNFHFFRQIRNWLKQEGNIKGQKDSARLYMMRCKAGEDGERFSVLEDLDSLLERYNSEYVYLFKLVWDRAQTKDEPGLERDYVFPNVLRKLLENYLSFKVPIDGIRVHEKFVQLLEDYPDSQIPRTSKERMESYCHDNSHPMYQDSPIDFDERLMGELQPACNDVVELIKKTDPRHFDHLLSQIQVT